MTDPTTPAAIWRKLWLAAFTDTALPDSAYPPGSTLAVRRVSGAEADCLVLARFTLDGLPYAAVQRIANTNHANR